MDTARRSFLVMDFPRFLGKAVADILAVPDQRLNKCMKATLERVLSGYIYLAQIFTGRSAAHHMRSGGQTDDPRVVADRADNRPLPGLELKIVAGAEPAFEAMAVAAG